MEWQRLGRKTTQYCPSCGVVLCENSAGTNFIRMILSSQPAVHSYICFLFQLDALLSQSRQMRWGSFCAGKSHQHRTARTGKTYSPRKKGQKKKRGVTEDEDEESKHSDANETPMQQVLRVTQNRGSSPNRDSLFSLPDNSAPQGSKKHLKRQSPM